MILFLTISLIQSDCLMPEKIFRDSWVNGFLDVLVTTTRSCANGLLRVRLTRGFSFRAVLIDNNIFSSIFLTGFKFMKKVNHIFSSIWEGTLSMSVLIFGARFSTPSDLVSWRRRFASCSACLFLSWFLATIKIILVSFWNEKLMLMKKVLKV